MNPTVKVMGSPLMRGVLLSGWLLAFPHADILCAQEEAVPRVRTGLGVEGAPYPYSDPAALGLDPASLSSLGDLVVEWVQDGMTPTAPFDTPTLELVLPWGIVGAEIMVLKDRQVVLHEAIGWSDNVRKEPMRRNSIFQIRSMTKPFTGTAVLMLAEEGLLDLDDPVSRYLPSFRNEQSRSITLRHLLSHTSGFVREFFPIDNYGSLRGAVDALGEMGPPTQPPGEAYLYTDKGFWILGAVVEEVSGMPVERFIETRIIEPLGLTDTHTRFTRDAPWAVRVNSRHRRSGDGTQWERFWDNTREPQFPFFRASSGMYSTVMDYAKFMVAWMDGGVAGDVRILSEASVAEALTQSSEGDYGLSWDLRKRGGFESLFMFGHGGSDGTSAKAVPEHDLLVFFFMQSRSRYGPHNVLFINEAVRALVSSLPAR